MKSKAEISKQIEILETEVSRLNYRGQPAEANMAENDLTQLREVHLFNV
jgi:hypothetical protein